MIVVGDFTPGSGAAAFLDALGAWAEAHPERRFEVIWAGQGDVAGLLAARPAPSNLFQMFVGPRNREQLAFSLETAGLLVVPGPCTSGAPVAEALAAGLPVLGSRCDETVAQLVRHRVDGWLFDPETPGAQFESLGQAATIDDVGLAAMRVRCRATVCPGSTGPVRMSPPLERAVRP